MARPRPDPRALRASTATRAAASRSRSASSAAPTWNYLCLEADLPEAGDYRTTFVGEMPVVVVRDDDGEIHAFENRCAHRGALIALDEARQAREDFQCVYHAWSYNLQGDLTGVAFEKGVKGQGGMPADFCKADHGPRKLRIASSAAWCSAASATTCRRSRSTWARRSARRIERVLHKPVRGASAASPRRCRTTGSSTWRT